jgi:flagellar biosynthesis/type III secretory pathway protein FliH
MNAGGNSLKEIERRERLRSLGPEAYEAYLQGCVDGRTEVAVPSYQRGFAEGYEHGMQMAVEEKRLVRRRSWLFVLFCLFCTAVVMAWR